MNSPKFKRGDVVKTVCPTNGVEFYIVEYHLTYGIEPNIFFDYKLRSTNNKYSTELSEQYLELATATDVLLYGSNAQISLLNEYEGLAKAKPH